MSTGVNETLQPVLWPAGAGGPSVWAVLDGARDPAIHLALLDSRLEYRCLYSGKLPRALEMAAPQLVELIPGQRLTNRLLGEAFGRAWGVLLAIDDASNLRHHLRKFLRVQDEGGRKLLFRFYDPRVLVPFLRSCDSDQLREFFGPIQRFACEEAGGGALIEFRLNAGRLVERRVALEAAALG